MLEVSQSMFGSYLPTHSYLPRVSLVQSHVCCDDKSSTTPTYLFDTATSSSCCLCVYGTLCYIIELSHFPCHSLKLHCLTGVLAS